MNSFVDRLSLVHPTLVVDKERAVKNIRAMQARASNQGLQLRPHFKTHQSAEIGEWFRDLGITSITASSIEMAQYFATHGWEDITVAFPLNVRAMPEVNQLARDCRLNVWVDSVETARRLCREAEASLSVWIDIDHGYHRTGKNIRNGIYRRSCRRHQVYG